MERADPGGIRPARVRDRDLPATGRRSLVERLWRRGVRRRRLTGLEAAPDARRRLLPAARCAEGTFPSGARDRDHGTSGVDERRRGAALRVVRSGPAVDLPAAEEAVAALLLALGPGPGVPAPERHAAPRGGVVRRAFALTGTTA